MATRDARQRLVGKKLAVSYPCREAHGAVWV